MKAIRLIRKLSNFFPRRLTSWKGDRLGLQIGPLPGEVNSIVVALDLDQKAIDLARQIDAHLIFTHHPLLYPNKKEALHDSRTLNLYQQCLDLGIAVYAYHTNFDASNHGMNATLLKQLGLQNIHRIDETHFSYVGSFPEPRSIETVLDLINDRWKLPFCQFFTANKETKKIQTVAVCAGSGSGEWEIVKQQAVDLFISGDSRHHHRVAMYWNGLHFVEVHHEVEQLFMEQMALIIHSIDPQIQIGKAQSTPFPMVYISKS